MDREQALIVSFRKKANEFSPACTAIGCSSKAAQNHSVSRAQLRAFTDGSGHVYELNRFNHWPKSGYRLVRVGINQLTSEAIHFRCYCSTHDNEIFSEIDKSTYLDLHCPRIQRLIYIRALSHEYHKQLRHIAWYSLTISSKKASLRTDAWMHARRNSFKLTSDAIRLQINKILTNDIEWFSSFYEYIVVDVPPAPILINTSSGVMIFRAQGPITPDLIENKLPSNLIYYVPPVDNRSALVVSRRDIQDQSSYVKILKGLSPNDRVRQLGQLVLRFCETWAISSSCYARLKARSLDERIVGTVNALLPYEKKFSPIDFDLIQTLNSA